MEWGEHLEMLEKQVAQGITPPALKNRPKLLDSLNWHYSCFLDMMYDRPYTQGQPLRLTTSAIKTWFDAFGIENWEAFYDKIKLIDGAWLREVSKRAKLKADQQAQQAKKTPTASRRR